jgi:hypothetical protein
MNDPIRPALTSEEWEGRRSGPVHVEIINDEVHVVVRDPDDSLVSVSGTDELCALIALANDALPDDEARKLTRTDVVLLRILADQIDAERPGGIRLLGLTASLHDKLVALVRH